MPKINIVPAALSAAMLLIAMPASARTASGPEALKNAEADPAAAIAIPSLIRGRAQPDQSGAPDRRSVSADQICAKAAEPDDGAPAARMQSSNTLKQIGLANRNCG